MIKKIPPTLVVTILLVLCITGAGCTGSVSPAAAGSAGSTSVPADDVVAGTPSLSSPSCTPVTITQTDGSAVTLPCRPKRIIVGNANAAEMMIAIGAQDKIVGVTQSTTNVSYIMDRIPGAENIGDWQVPNIERILSLHPDVVITYASSKPKNIDQLTAANISVVYLDCYRLRTLAGDARALGVLTGTEDKAETYARMVEGTISSVSGRVGNISPDDYPSVYSEQYSAYTVSGPSSGADEQLTLAGGRNIASEIPTSSAKINTEWIVSKKPEYIFKVVSSTTGSPSQGNVDSLNSRPGWQEIPAVKNNHVYVFSNEIQFGPRSYIGLVYLARILHPEVFPDMDPRAMLDEYAGTYVPKTNLTTMEYPPGPGSLGK